MPVKSSAYQGVILFCVCRNFWLHVGINSLNIVKLFQLLNHLVDSFTLLRSYILQIVRDVSELGTSYLETLSLQMLLNLAEACRSTVDSDFVVLLILIKLIFYILVNKFQDEFIHIEAILFLKSEHTLMIE